MMHAAAPRTADALHEFIVRALGFDVPRRSIVAGHDAPFDYLMHAFFEDSPGPRDCLVWANRGGGKTQLGAIATLLDLLFKPGIHVCILAGSFEQSSKMYAALSDLLAGDLFRPLVTGNITGRSVHLANGSQVDVLERCPPQRRCEFCPLWPDCGGSAKGASGFFRIDDAITQMERISRDAWESEMLCERPSVADRVYPEFDPAVHVKNFEPPPSAAADLRHDSGRWLGGIDFGYRSPTVLLWAWLDEERDILHVVDEHVATERTQRFHIEEAAKRPWPRPEFLAADPAGNQRNDQTGRSAIRLWRDAGWKVCARQHTILEGIEHVRARLRSADGMARLVVHPRCRVLIESLQKYHFPPEREEDCNPVKDGPDHAADALRYLVVNLDARSGKVVSRGY